MSETPNDGTEGGTVDGAADAPAPRRATPGAAAARARRIGGRPLRTGPAPAARPAPAADQPVEDEQSVDQPGETPVEAQAPVETPIEDPANEGAAPATAGTSTWATPADAPAGGTGGWLNWAPAAVLAAGALVMAILLIAFSHGVWWGPVPSAKPPAAKVNQARDQVLAAAKSCVVQANNYDYRSLDAYETRALACTTGQLTAQLKHTIDNQVKQLAPGLKAKQTAQISRAGIESVSPDGSQWTLLVFGQLSVVNANYPKGRTDPFGAQVVVEKTHGKWLLADLKTVSSPVAGG